MTDATTPDHLVLQSGHPCGAKGCRETAHRWVRCRTCKVVVARCGAHDANLEQQTKDHCR